MESSYRAVSSSSHSQYRRRELLFEKPKTHRSRLNEPDQWIVFFICVQQENRLMLVKFQIMVKLCRAHVLVLWRDYA